MQTYEDPQFLKRKRYGYVLTVVLEEPTSLDKDARKNVRREFMVAVEKEMAKWKTWSRTPWARRS